MHHNTSSICSVCSQYTVITDRNHKCTEKFYSLITQIIQVKSDTSSLLDSTTNLVFQGGGVKGIAYLGALEQLQTEGKLRNRDFLCGIKRIAGTSAGSIVALYLGLNLDVEKNIRPLMEKSYSRLLDDGLVLKVAINPGGITMFGPSHKNFKAKHIVLKALKYFEDLDVLLKSGQVKAHNEAEKSLKVAINKIFSYYGTKVGFLPGLAIKIKGSDFAADATKWLLDLLKPPKKPEPVKAAPPSYDERVKRSSAVPGGYMTQSPYISQGYSSYNTTAVDPYTESVKRAGASSYGYNQSPSYVYQTEALSRTANNAKVDEPIYERSSYYSDSFSTKNSSASSFEDIINGECSGILSESDKLDLSLSTNQGSQDNYFRSESPIPQANLTKDQLYSTGYSITNDILRSINPTPVTSTDYRSYSTDPQRTSTADPYVSYQSTSFLGSQTQINNNYSPTPYSTVARSVGGEGGYFDPDRIERSSRVTVDYERSLPRNVSLEASAPYYSTRSATRAENPVIMDVLKKAVSPNGNLVKNTGTIVEEELPVEQHVSKAKKEDAEEYIARSQRKIIAAAPEAELTPDVLPYALGELLWFCIITQQNAAGAKEQLGLFDGSEVKRELIEQPMIDRLLKLGLEPKMNITFKELMDYNVMLSEENKFKKFYVTAFNTETSKTEVFSVEHTPNVVIADAVRASMSIPVFFSPVTIREKNSLGQLEERRYFDGIRRNVVHYMDGGILDNYPMWIFDDIKYCFDDSFSVPKHMKCSIQNPNTLGFRLLDEATIEKYTNPRFIGKVGTGVSKDYQETFSYQMGLLMNAFMNEAQENEHIKRGDCGRSVYVDNLGVSAIAFSLSDAERESLINSGRQSVLNYKDRAAKNFNGEGQIH